MTAIQPVPHGIAEPEGASRAEWARGLAVSAAWPLFTGFTAAATVIAVVLSTTPGAQFSGQAVLGGAAPLWLAAHQVPLMVRGVPFGALPLLPTVLVVLFALRGAVTATRRLRPRTWEQATAIVSGVGGAHGVFGAVLAGLVDGPVSADATTAFFGCALLAGAGATCGVVWCSRARGRFRRRADPSAVRGLRAGALGLAALFTAGAALTSGKLVVSSGTARELFASVAPDAGSAFGLWLLSVAYLPNAVIAAVAFLVGPGFAIGQVAVSPLSALPGAVPPVPLLAAIPESEAHGWWMVAFVAPLAVGVLVGWSCRRWDPNPLARLRVVAVAAVVVGLVCFLAAALTGGRLGAGAFDPVSVPAGLVAVAAFCWISLPGGVVAWFAGPRQERRLRDDVVESESAVPTEAAPPGGVATAVAAADVVATETATAAVAAAVAEDEDEDGASDDGDQEEPEDSDDVDGDDVGDEEAEDASSPSDFSPSDFSPSDSSQGDASQGDFSEDHSSEGDSSEGVSSEAGSSEGDRGEEERDVRDERRPGDDTSR
ncbi:cell division protein PerM [Streptoalloteichus tenebrarius]|uniref:cell division protein PerM n=1 Tax=Streptoalloteichus tenebrarius (strain ATCC 17920 / DSM 40477 / JCM 4838 / CBS 697.72 / NBRC 16177 / NCIMB 11028 / NRRL B-12390 / A12253. 1 / ISP 5477) TaxID=1933 RepID=UPI0020A4C15E|nr:DUF6350 family protein [Streptoalloteichus tenebrarius]